MTNAGRDATVVSMSLYQGMVNATRDAFVYAVEGIQNSGITGGRDAAVVSWGPAVPGVVVSGMESALLWVDGDIGFSSVTSSNGSAVAIGYGNATLLTVSGATDAAAITTGSMLGAVSGNDFAALIALGGFTSGTVTSLAGDGVILSEGPINGSLNVAGDGGLYAYGDITGTHWAGNDIAAFTFGSFNANLSAGHDVLGVTSVGNLLGSIRADHNIGGDIQSYGQINANISALNLALDPSGGSIGNVLATGDISGSITAVGELGAVTSGANLFATLSAGTLGTLTVWDSTLAGSPPPTAPAPIAPTLLAQVATARGQVINDRTDAYNDFLALLGDVAIAQSDAATDITTASNAVVSQTAQAISDSSTALSDAQSDAAPQFTSEVTATVALANAQANRDSAESAASDFDAELATNTTAHNDERQADERDAATLAIKIATSRINVSLDKDKAADELRDKLDEERDWDGKWTPSFETIVNSLADAVNPVKIVREKFEQVGQQFSEMSHLADEAQETGVRRYYMIIGGIVADMVGLRQLVGAFDGADPYTLEKWSTAERILNGAMGGFTLVTTAVGISQFLSRVVTPCGSRHWGSCFTADMLAENQPEAETQVIEIGGPPDVDGETASSWFGAAFTIATVGLGGGYLYAERQRYRERRRRWQQTIDELFGGKLLDDVLLPTA